MKEIELANSYCDLMAALKNHDLHYAETLLVSVWHNLQNQISDAYDEDCREAEITKAKRLKSNDAQKILIQTLIYAYYDKDNPMHDLAALYVKKAYDATLNNEKLTVSL